MNDRTFNRLIEISKALKPKRSTGRAFHTTFAVRNRRIIKIGINDYNKIHPAYKYGEYYSYKEFGSVYRPSIHSEIKMLIRLGEEDLSQYEIVNVRINNNNVPAMSAPCPNCARVLKALNPKAIYYSTDKGYEKLDCK